MGNNISYKHKMGDYISVCLPDPAKFTGNLIERLIQIIFMLLCYGFILFKGSDMISNGSELLLLTPYAPFIGSIVLPILGAVPDGAIILFSGMGPDAKEQISIGVGALAGSTIMLLTIPWFVSIWWGRVDGINIVKDLDRYYKNPKEKSRLTIKGCGLTNTGVKICKPIKRLGLLMLATTTSYIIVQGVSFTNVTLGPSHDQIFIPAIIALITSLLFFSFYLYYCVKDQNSEHA